MFSTTLPLSDMFFGLFAPFLTDFYKTGHIYQYPPLTEAVYTNFTCRSDAYASMLPDFDHRVVFFGLRGFLKTFLNEIWDATFFRQPKELVLQIYKDMMDQSLGKDSVGIDHIADLHDLGYLPIVIKALPEGSRVNIRCPLFTIKNTVSRFYWITNYLETVISAEMWKAITSATKAYEFRRLFLRYAEETGGSPEFVDFQGHDFSARGMSGIIDAIISGAAHLTSFKGTDTIASIRYLQKYYDAKGLIGASVPATEHSVMCAGGEQNELETYRRLITQVYPKGIVSIVSDTWDFWNVITNYTVVLKETILAREGKVVLRPDSGDPVKIIVGDPDAPEGSPERKGAVQCLWEVFGGKVNEKGFKELDPHIGLIYGDSISLTRAFQILEGLKMKGFCSNAIVFGIGSFTYQYVTRDSLGSAMKATWSKVNGLSYNLFKDPKTDSGVKKSLCGLIRVEKENGAYVPYDHQTEEQETKGLLAEVWKDGKFIREETFDEIKARLASE